ncbi:MAG: carbohydrate binding domain-containing protein [Planctomycetaceae bacterium]|nr:carbohydrate binding domain-containing protein [Planctomycetaceae bacterium]
MAQTGPDNLPAMFPFVISFDAPDNITNISSQLEAPAGKSGFVRVEDGCFVTDRGPIRFWGTNLTFMANFPTPEQADQLADRLARFGYNCARLHHVDTGNNSLVSGRNTLTELDPKKLDAYDRLVAALKKRGIYVNINLHVGRWFDDRDGFPFRDQRPDFDKGVGNFEPRMIEYQKKYAKDLLTHVNPYTKLAYCNDPCVAMVEISNEDSIVVEWCGGKLETLPEPYLGLLRKLWNDWLRNKYQTTEQLRTAWGCSSVPLGKEMLTAGTFDNDEAVLSRQLSLHTDDQSDSEMWVTDGLLKIRVTKMGRENWIPQLYFRPCAVEKDKPYQLTIKIRSDKPTKVMASVRMDHEPWEAVGCQKNLAVGPEWKTFEMPFHATADDGQARINLNDFQPDTIYEIDTISLRPGGTFGLQPDQSLESGNVSLLGPFEQGALQNTSRDFIEFLFDIENDYWLGMHDYIKNDLKVQAPVTGTQLNYGSTQVQAKLDYCDNHSYWNHPVFPGRPWDMNNWYVSNISLANHADTGTLTRLATRRVAGKPYTVSEYDHPFPNEYNAEGYPMIAAFGRFQNWDAVFPFAYTGGNDFAPQNITGFFDSIGNAARTAHTIACHEMFVRGDVAVARQTFDVGMTPEQEVGIMLEKGGPYQIGWGGLNADERTALLHGTRLELTGKSSLELPAIPKDQKLFVSDTKQMRWDMTEQGKGYMTVDSPNTKLFSGFVPKKPVILGDVTLEIGKTQLGWCTISLVSVNGNGFGQNDQPNNQQNDQPTRLLVAATGKCLNTGMTLESLGNGRVTVGNRWGAGPVLCEGIPAKLTLPVDPGRIKFFPLDASGNRKTAVPVKNANSTNNSTNNSANGSANGSMVELTPEAETLWYEIVIEKPTQQ